VSADSSAAAAALGAASKAAAVAAAAAAGSCDAVSGAEHWLEPPPGTTELPTCPVCLERLDEHISGIVTTVSGSTLSNACQPSGGYLQVPPHTALCSWLVTAAGRSASISAGWCCCVCPALSRAGVQPQVPWGVHQALGRYLLPCVPLLHAQQQRQHQPLQHMWSQHKPLDLPDLWPRGLRQVGVAEAPSPGLCQPSVCFHMRGGPNRECTGLAAGRPFQQPLRCVGAKVACGRIVPVCYSCAGTSRVMPMTIGSHQRTAMHWSWRHSGCGTMQVRQQLCCTTCVLRQRPGLISVDGPPAQQLHIHVIACVAVA
jgi:hypothetical protein